MRLVLLALLVTHAWAADFATQARDQVGLVVADLVEEALAGGKATVVIPPAQPLPGAAPDLRGADLATVQVASVLAALRDRVVVRTPPAVEDFAHALGVWNDGPTLRSSGFGRGPDTTLVVTTRYRAEGRDLVAEVDVSRLIPGTPPRTERLRLLTPVLRGVLPVPVVAAPAAPATVPAPSTPSTDWRAVLAGLGRPAFACQIALIPMAGDGRTAWLDDPRVPILTRTVLAAGESIGFVAVADRPCWGALIAAQADGAWQVVFPGPTAENNALGEQPALMAAGRIVPPFGAEDYLLIAHQDRAALEGLVHVLRATSRERLGHTLAQAADGAWSWSHLPVTTVP